MINPAKVTDHRKPQFRSADDVWADVERLIAADRAGTLRQTGNWTIGKSLGHLAAWINYPYDGYPMRPPWFIKVLTRLMKKKFLYGGLQQGVRITRGGEGTYGVEPLSTDEGLSRYRQAWERLRKAPPPVPNPLFGPLTHEEWIALHCRHAELHLGYLHAS